MACSTGGAVAAFMINPFLVDIPSHVSSNNHTELQQNSSENVERKTVASSSSQQQSNASEFTALPQRSELEMVRYAYVLIGSLCCLGGVMFAILFLANGCTMSKIEKLPKEEGKEDGMKDKVTSAKRYFYPLFMFCLLVFFYLYVYIEGIPGSYISLFLVNGLDWTVQDGALASSVFWGSVTIGRILNIFLSLRLSPQIIVGSHLLDVLLAFVVLLLFIDFGGKTLIFVCIVVAGIGIGPVFAAQMLWASRIIPFSGTASGLVVASNSLGKVSALALTGYMMERDYMWMLYIVVAGGVLILIMYLLMLILVRLCGPKSSEPPANKENEFMSMQSIA